MKHFYPKRPKNDKLLEKKKDELQQLKELNNNLQLINQDNQILNQDIILSSKSKHDKLKLQKLARDYFFLKDKFDRAGNF